MIRPTTSRPPDSPAVEAARRAVLEHLERAGPVRPGDIPGRWPLTRHHVRMVIGELVSDGLVASERPGGSRVPLITLTPAGHAAIRSGR